MTERSEVVINKPRFFICKYRRKYLQKRSHKYLDIINMGTLRGTSHKAAVNTIDKNRLRSICQFVYVSCLFVVFVLCFLSSKDVHVMIYLKGMEGCQKYDLRVLLSTNYLCIYVHTFLHCVLTITYVLFVP